MIKHRVPRRGEILLPYAENKNGMLVHASSVARGRACTCICPACHEPVIAKQGDERADHFAHESDVDCPHAVETTLHKLAKQYLTNNSAIRIPELRASWKGRSQVVFPEGEFRYSQAWLEYRVSDVIPDVILEGPFGLLLVEIFVSHACDAEKQAKLDALGVAAIEIDLSGYNDLSGIELEGLILREARRKWLHHPSLSAAIEKLREEGDATKQRERIRERQQRDWEVAARTRLRERVKSRHARAGLMEFPPEAETQNGREKILSRAAQEYFGIRGESWMISPNAALEGHSPRARARSSIHGLRIALAAMRSRRGTVFDVY